MGTLLSQKEIPISGLFGFCLISVAFVNAEGEIIINWSAVFKRRQTDILSSPVIKHYYTVCPWIAHEGHCSSRGWKATWQNSALNLQDN